MTGIELLRKYAETRLSDGTCRQMPDAFGKGCDDFGNCDDCHRFVRRVIADQIERETLQKPRFEDGEPVQFGDEFEADGRRMVIYDMCVSTDGSYRISCEDQTACVFEAKKPLKRPVAKVLDADGVEIKVGDEVWEVEGDSDPLTVVEINGERVIGKLSSVLLVDIHCSKVTHKRPEPPDTWERIEDDIVNKISPCEYFGWSGKSCCDDGECPVFGNEISCTESRASDLVRRCKKLAGVE